MLHQSQWQACPAWQSRQTSQMLKGGLGCVRLLLPPHIFPDCDVMGSLFSSKIVMCVHKRNCGTQLREASSLVGDRVLLSPSRRKRTSTFVVKLEPSCTRMAARMGWPRRLCGQSIDRGCMGAGICGGLFFDRQL